MEAELLDARKTDAAREFEAAFGRPLEAVAWAPGRVNLIGEHTDYNDGLVLPAALERGIVVAAAARRDGVVRALSSRYGGPIEVGRTLGGTRTVELPPWAAYVRAVAREIVGAAPSGPGADLWIGGDLPSAAGLSSSAALVVACALALAEVSGVESPARNTVGFAQMVRLVEHRAGTLCGIMDPVVVLEGRRGCALRIDCRSLEIAEVPLPPDTLLVVCDSGLERALAQSAYNQRRDECEIARGALERLSGRAIRSLRDATRDDLAVLARASPGESYRRARHVVEENYRVDRLVDALWRNDREAVGRLMDASHESLRNDFEVSTPELDALVEDARGAPGCWGTRMTGAGFGGSTVSLVDRDAAPAFMERMEQSFRARYSRSPRPFASPAGIGARLLQ
ncbi:MAG TPA: galactokinase [Gemmatimonadota bacterium]|nr:galactokinase [Gemmatimonadota bacterium]